MPATAPLDHADRARLAHRALRLRESGYETETQIRALAAQAPPAVVMRAIDPRRAALIHDTPDEHRTVHVGGGNPHAEIALAVVSMLEPDLPGPTDADAVLRVMADLGDLDSIWKEWDEATTAHLEATLSTEALQDLRESQQRDFSTAKAAWDAAGFDIADIHPYFGHGRHLAGAANAFYDFGRQGFLDGSIDWDTATIKLLLVDSAVYTVNLATHQFASSIASSVATTAALANKTTTAGVADADDPSFGNVTGAQSEAVVIVQTSAVGGGADVAATSQRLIGYIDTATGLPVTPNGGPINVVFDSGANRIFKL